jgi:predicted nucleic acid-binding protein
VTEFVLDASFTLQWCFENEATRETESVLTLLQNQEAMAWVPGIWPYEVLNGLGKGISRGRLDRAKGLLFWQAIKELPVQVLDVQVDQNLLDLALQQNLSVYDASYLGLAMTLKHALATNDKKLTAAAKASNVGVYVPDL